MARSSGNTNDILGLTRSQQFGNPAVGCIWLAFTRAISISERESPALSRVLNSGYTGFHALLRLQLLWIAR